MVLNLLKFGWTTCSSKPNSLFIELLCGHFIVLLVHIVWGLILPVCVFVFGIHICVFIPNKQPALVVQIDLHPLSFLLSLKHTAAGVIHSCSPPHPSPNPSFVEGWLSFSSSSSCASHSLLSSKRTDEHIWPADPVWPFSSSSLSDGRHCCWGYTRTHRHNPTQIRDVCVCVFVCMLRAGVRGVDLWGSVEERRADGERHVLWLQHGSQEHTHALGHTHASRSISRFAVYVVVRISLAMQLRPLDDVLDFSS